MRNIYLLFLLFLTIEGFSQQYNIVNYSVKQGLPNSNVYSILQDGKGYMWYGTEGGGLCRFDGKEFKTYTTADGLAGNIVRTIYERKNGELLIGTDKGISIFNGKTFKNITDFPELKGVTILTFHERNENEVWFGTNSYGLSRMLFTNDSIQIKNFTTRDGLPGIMVTDICPQGDSILWLATPANLTKLEFIQDTFFIKRTAIEDNKYSTMIWDIEIDKYNTLWATTLYSGLYKYNTADSFAKESFSPVPIPQIEKQPLWNLYIDKNNTKWIGTDKSGIIKMDNNTTVINSDNGLPGNQAYSAYEDNENNLWFSVLGKGICVYKGDELIQYKKHNDTGFGEISSFTYDQHNNLYFASSKGVFQLSDTNNIAFTPHPVFGTTPAKHISTIDNKLAIITTQNEVLIADGNNIIDYSDTLHIINESVNCLFYSTDNKLWTGTNSGIKEYNGIELLTTNENNGLINNEIQTITEDKEGYIWLGTLNGLVKLKRKKTKELDNTYFDEEEGLMNKQIHSLYYTKDHKLFIGTFGGGIYQFDLNSTDSLPIQKASFNSELISQNIFSITEVNDSLLIVGTDKGISKVYKEQSNYYVQNIGINDGFTRGEVLLNAAIMKPGGSCLFGTNEGLFKLQYNKSKENDLPRTTITNIRLFYENVDWQTLTESKTNWFNLPQNLELSYNENHLSFDFISFNYNNPEKVQYSHQLEGFESSWSPLSTVSSVTYPNLPSGSYTFKVKATSDKQHWSQVSEYKIVISPPFWQTIWFYILVTITILLTFYYYIKARERKHIRRSLKLERIVQERTREIAEQKDRIEQQHKTVLEQKKEITDSIQYAQRIQKAVLPAIEKLNNNTADNFILFKPRDIVSGDFYWIEEINNKLIFTAADCTGHGVPGAFMSMLGISGLNKIVNEAKIESPDQILGMLRSNIINAMKQTGSISENKDGMDMALCCYDIDTQKLYFSGANNPLLVIRNGELLEFKGDSMPVAIYVKMDDFTLHSIDIQKGDTLYMFSDGFPDQFGGPKGKKFKIRAFKNLLLSIQDLTMADQRQKLDTTITDWMNEIDHYGNSQEQIDDICVIGVRF